jgi:hypothetical protein
MKSLWLMVASMVVRFVNWFLPPQNFSAKFEENFLTYPSDSDRSWFKTYVKPRPILKHRQWTYVIRHKNTDAITYQISASTIKDAYHKAFKAYRIQSQLRKIQRKRNYGNWYNPTQPILIGYHEVKS